MEDWAKQLLMAAVEVFWYWAWLKEAMPDRVLGVYQHLADALAYKDPKGQKERFLRLLAEAEVPAYFLKAKRV